MNGVASRILCLLISAVLLSTLSFVAASKASAQSNLPACWRVDSVEVGMRGEGLTVIKGTKIEKFQVEVLGVLKNTSPGRDLVLCQLSGLNLEKTGVIAGMSGSPVYIKGKLLGAVAYAWQFGKEPIAGITPFCQMHKFAQDFEKQDLAKKAIPQKIGLRQPIKIGDELYRSVTLDEQYNTQQAASAGFIMTPLKTPLATTGFSPAALRLLNQRLRHTGILPVQGGGVSSSVADKAMNTKLQPGGALTVAMVTGDFDISGIGTVTHIEGKRVYGWGHPFMNLGKCELPLMTGYVHTIYPRQSLSFKMGSPLKTVGVINADVSTCIAGWLDKKPDMIPVQMTIDRHPHPRSKEFNVEVIRHPDLAPTLVLTALVNSVDMEGQLPAEMTAHLKAVIEMDGREPLILEDTFSGSVYSGNHAPKNLYNQVAFTLQRITRNDFDPIRIKSIKCVTKIVDGQQTASIEKVAPDAKVYEPGETLTAAVFLRPHKSMQQKRTIHLKLPTDLPPGTYTARVGNGYFNARSEVMDDPNLESPKNVDDLLKSLRVRSAGRRTDLVIRVPLRGVGVAFDGQTLKNLPPSMIHILSKSRKSEAQPVSGALTARLPTEWVIENAESFTFRVALNKHALR